MVEMESSFRRDLLILLLLAACHGCQCGILYCYGLYQEMWMEELQFSAKEASWISGLAFSAFRIPSPLIEFMLQYFKIPPHIQLSAAGLSIGGGMLALSYATKFTYVLLASLCGIGFGGCISILSVYTSTYFFFKDKQIPLFMSIISAGAGLSVIIIALSFEWLERAVGWQSAFRYQIIFCIPYLIAAVVLCPQTNPNLLPNQKQRNESSEDPIGLQAVKDHDKPILKNKKGVLVHERNEQNENQDVEKQMQQRSSPLLRSWSSWNNVVFNMSFLLLLSSWSVAGGTFKAIMVHEPQRIIHLGYTMKNSAESLAINGGVQFASRLTVGILASANLVSVIRLSQIAKLLLAIATFISVFYTNLPVQHGFMLILGACGGIINTTDVILVKDCFQNGREIALSLFIFIDAISTLIATTSGGYLVDFFDSYRIVFIIYGACFVLGAIFTFLMERTLPQIESSSVIKVTSSEIIQSENV